MAINRNNQGTSFTNYGDILKANQQSGQRMGQAVAGGLESQGQALNQDLASQQQEFQQGLGQSQSDWSNQSALAKQLAGLGSQQDWSGIANVNNPDFAKAGSTFRNYNYTGPTGLKGSGGLQAQANAASEASRMAGTAHGQQQLLGQYVGGRGYNQGQSSFDQALLNKYGRNQINQAKKGLAGLGEKVGGAVAGAAGAANLQSQNVKSQQTEIGKKLLQSLQGDGTSGGVLGIGKQALASEKGDVDRIKQLLSIGAGGKPNIDPESYTAADRQLLANLGDRFGRYGVNTQKEYFYNEPVEDQMIRAKQGVQSIAGNLNVGGNFLLTPEQQAAATALAQFTGNKQVVEPGQFTDLTKTFDPATLNNIIGQTTDVSKQETQDRFDKFMQNRDWWNQNAPLIGTLGIVGSDVNSEDIGRQANARSIGQGYGSFFSQDAAGMTQQALAKGRQEGLKASGQKNLMDFGTSQKLIDFLNRYNTNPT